LADAIAADCVDSAELTSDNVSLLLLVTCIVLTLTVTEHETKEPFVACGWSHEFDELEFVAAKAICEIPLMSKL
jgi:hypothetical protein